MSRWRVWGLVVLVAGLIPAEAHDAGFSLRCYFSHRLSDDPIVYPGVAGQSHAHEFIGNTTTNASSTSESLRGQPTNCSIDGNSSGYWIPTLLNAEKPVAPSFVNIYYRPGTKDRRTVKPFPAGLKMITGDSRATSPQRKGVVSWGCGANGVVYLYSTMPNCPSGYDLVLYVWFPDCWNGKALDSTDHKSHMAYASNNTCPYTHRVPVPQLVLSVHYPLRGGSSLYLSSGGRYSGHADFMEAWNRALFESLVTRCINNGEHCHF
jgi:uncharacterized protein DUF1996